MSVRFTKPQTEEEMITMATRKAEAKERASVSRERRLALALVALRDGIADGDTSNELIEAEALLAELGYATLQSIPSQIRDLDVQLQTALGAGDYATVASVGAEMARVKAGKFHKAAEAVGE